MNITQLLDVLLAQMDNYLDNEHKKVKFLIFHNYKQSSAPVSPSILPIIGASLCSGSQLSQTVLLASVLEFSSEVMDFDSVSFVSFFGDSQLCR
ncbi:MAG: hypothetical protein ACEY3C_02995 [Candidatus Tisiphia sp.]